MKLWTGAPWQVFIPLRYKHTRRYVKKQVDQQSQASRTNVDTRMPGHEMRLHGVILARVYYRGLTIRTAYWSATQVDQ